jgi:signal transduction histidine kinase
MAATAYASVQVAERAGILEAWAAGAPLTEVLNQVCRHIDREIPGAVTAVLLLDDREMQFRLAAGPGIPKALSEVVDGLTIPATIPSTKSNGDRPVAVWDIRTESIFAPRRDAALKSGFVAAWSLPIWSTERKLLGTVVIFQPKYRSPLAELLRRVETMCNLAAIAVNHHHREKELRELSRQLLLSQDNERRRIARDLHDSTGQDLAGLMIGLELAQRQAPEDSEKLRKVLSDCDMLARRLSGEIRTLCCLLHPPLLDIGGLGAAIEAYADELNRRDAMRIDLEISQQLPRLTEDAEIALFRVVQASFTNVLVHSGTKAAKITIEHTAEALTLTIADDGCGMPVEKLNHIMRSGQAGVGIAGMRERVTAFGGRLEIKAGSEHRGTVVKVTVPSRIFREEPN